tara:strand:- start:496 stop:690 length:195 start_codon:yes stop_codon:yes gene_type:complete
VRLNQFTSIANSIDEEIGDIIGGPALAGHKGECIAANIFDIALIDDDDHVVSLIRYACPILCDH